MQLENFVTYCSEVVCPFITVIQTVSVLRQEFGSFWLIRFAVNIVLLSPCPLIGINNFLFFSLSIQPLAAHWPF